MNTVIINRTHDNSASLLARNRPLYSKKEFALLSDILKKWCEASLIPDILPPPPAPRNRRPSRLTSLPQFRVLHFDIIDALTVNWFVL